MAPTSSHPIAPKHARVLRRTCLAVLLAGVIFAATYWLAGSDGAAPVRARDYSAAVLTAAIDRLLQQVHPDQPENEYFPAFARQKLEWLYAHRRTGALRIVLIQSDDPWLSGQALMGASVARGPAILIGEREFRRFLSEGPGAEGPFTAQQRNDFMLGLVHESVHLENPNLPDPSTLTRSQRVAEEVRAWREVTVRVVRPLRKQGRPMHATFERVDEAFRACGDRSGCQPLPLTMIAGG